MENWIVPDTNYFLHFTPVDEIDWKQIVPGSTFVLVLSNTVLKELDHHKYSDKARVQARAKKTIARLLPLLESGGRFNNGSRFQYFSERLNKLPFAELDLEPDNNDHHLIALVSYLTSLSESEGRKVTFVTGDAGAYMLAKGLHVNAVLLGPDHRAAEAEHPAEAELRQARLQLRKFEARFPKLTLQTQDGEDRVEARVVVTNQFQFSSLDNELLEYRALNPPMSIDKTEVSNPTYVDENGVTRKSIRIQRSLTAGPSNRQREEFNLNLEKHFTEYRKFLDDAKTFEHFRNTSIRLTLALENTGYAPANDIQIEIFGPEGVRFVSEQKAPDEPTRPIAPSRPKHSDMLETFKTMARFGGGSLGPSILGDFNYVHSNRIGSPSNVGSWRTDRDRSRAVLKIKKARQGHSLNLPMIHVVFESAEQIRSFAMQLRLSADELLEPASESFHVILNKGGKSKD